MLSVQNDMPEQPSAPRSPGSGPPTSPPRGRSAHRTPTRSRWTSARPHVATTNVPAIARDPGPTTRLRSAPGSLGSNRLTKSSNRYPPAKSRMSYHFSFSCIETYMNYARTIKVGCWLFFSGILPPSRRTTARRPPRHRRRSTSTPINYQHASLARCRGATICMAVRGIPLWGA